MDVRTMLLPFLLLLGCHGNVMSGRQTTEDDIKHVQLIFMNHLDVGYSLKMLPGYLVDVLNAYFTQYFPRAIQIALQLKEFKYVERFIYTTHPWLVSMYLDCPPNLVLSGRKLQCPSASDVDSFKGAIKRGDITWHAGPMNMEYEIMDESMVEFAVQLGIDLDKRFGIERKYRTASQRDVPGTTKAVIPILEKMGIAALSVGVNGATTPAAVPPVFTWKSGNSSLVVLYHPGGYPKKYVSPWIPGGLSRKDCAIVPGLDTALCFAFRDDNQGPPADLNEVLNAYEIARSQFPNAEMKAAPFEDFIALLQPFKSKLPVFTQEMGDVWIQGSGSDPKKTAVMRAMFRARTDCLKTGKCSLADPRVYNASRFMLKLGEHTWGLAGNCVDNIHWTNDQFDKMMKDPGHRYLNATNSWEEQRNFTSLALEALGNHTLADTIRMNFKALQPQKPDFTGYKRIKSSDTVMECKGFSFKVSDDGSLETLTDPKGRNWASSSNPIGRVTYQTYDQTDFDKLFNATTPYSKAFFLGIGKPNMSRNAAPESKIWDTSAGVDFDKEACTVLVTIRLPDYIHLWNYYGAPVGFTVNYTVSMVNEKPGINIEVWWYGKRPTRLPEGINFVFTPVQQPAHKWWLNKLEEMIDPLDVVVNGSQRLHAINRGVYYIDKSYHGLEILSPDSAVVNILTPEDYVSAIPLPLSPIKSVKGVAFNLYNNVWETNYIFWYPYRKIDADQVFRFRMNFS